MFDTSTIESESLAAGLEKGFSIDRGTVPGLNARRMVA